MRTSSPPPPWIVSTPAPPSRTLAKPLPVSVSFDADPTTFSMLTSVSVPSAPLDDPPVAVSVTVTALAALA